MSSISIGRGWWQGVKHAGVRIRQVVSLLYTVESSASARNRPTCILTYHWFHRKTAVHLGAPSAAAFVCTTQGTCKLVK